MLQDQIAKTHQQILAHGDVRNPATLAWNVLRRVYVECFISRLIGNAFGGRQIGVVDV